MKSLCAIARVSAETLCEICTKRFRVMTATANALAVRADALHAAEECVILKWLMS